ncbi:MAG: ribokinase [Lachnospiraceae bacterium]|nr:ribokinase [Lachnospiraceae bacterium]
MKIVNFGSLNIDYTFHVEEIVRPGQTVDSTGEQRFPGGKGLNQSLAVARAGSEVYHAGLIGEDGAFLKELLEKDGVDCRFVRQVEEGTGKAFIQVDACGQNCIVLSGGANRKNTRAFCDQVLDFFAAGDILLLQNEINEIRYLMERADEKGLTVVLNPSPMNEEVTACDLSRVDFFIMNEDEGRMITGREDSKEILAEMERRFPQAKVVLTLGEKGSVYAHRGERLHQGIYPVEAVDTTGAGDTFTGYLLAHMVKGDPMEICLERAAKASALAVTKAGAALAIPYASQLL